MIKKKKIGRNLFYKVDDWVVSAEPLGNFKGLFKHMDEDDSGHSLVCSIEGVSLVGLLFADTRTQQTAAFRGRQEAASVT